MKKVYEILVDLVNHIKDERPIKKSDKYRYNYDRGKWMSEFGVFDENDIEQKYEYSIETLRTLIYQIHFFGHVIHTNDDGKDIFNNKIIKERRF